MIKLLLSKLTESQNKLNNIYRNAKYKLLNKVKFVISGIQSTITIYVKKHKNITQNKDKMITQK